MFQSRSRDSLIGNQSYLAKNTRQFMFQSRSRDSLIGNQLPIVGNVKLMEVSIP